MKWKDIVIDILAILSYVLFAVAGYVCHRAGLTMWETALIAFVPMLLIEISIAICYNHKEKIKRAKRAKRKQYYTFDNKVVEIEDED